MLRRLFGRQEEKSADDIKIEESLQKTRSGIFGQIGSLFQENEISDELWEELEEALIVADVGMDTTMHLVESTRDRVEREGIRRTGDAYLILKQEMVKLLQADEPLLIEEPRVLTVVLVVGVNGSGKTTTIGKLALRYRERGKRVVLAAGDTFRAAAIDQLKIWGERADVEVISQAPGSDPAAVLFDAMRASQESRKADLLITDTAGRLQNKFNLMQELEKNAARGRQASSPRAARNPPGAGRVHRAERHFAGQRVQRGIGRNRYRFDQTGQHGQRRRGPQYQEATGYPGALCRHRRKVGGPGRI